MAELENYIIRPYQKGDNKCSFCCSIPKLDHYFRSSLSQDIKRSQAAGYVLWDEKQKTVAGYFTVSAIHIFLSQLPEQYKKKLPYSEVPFLLLGRLAIDENYKGKGLEPVVTKQANPNINFTDGLLHAILAHSIKQRICTAASNDFTFFA
ncbi:MAG: hypothetical protein R3F02_02395 [Thiolinea sp.]